MNKLKDRGMRCDLIEMYKVISSRKSTNWVKQRNEKKDVEISGPAVSVREDSLSMR